MKSELPDLEVRRAWKDKKPQRKRSQKIYSFKNRENPKRPRDEQQNIYIQRKYVQSVIRINHTSLAQPWEKNVINAGSLDILVHSVIQETQTTNRSKCKLPVCVMVQL